VSNPPRLLRVPAPQAKHFLGRTKRDSLPRVRSVMTGAKPEAPAFANEEEPGVSKLVSVRFS
jgi:hypothetical protein